MHARAEITPPRRSLNSRNAPKDLNGAATASRHDICVQDASRLVGKPVFQCAQAGPYKVTEAGFPASWSQPLHTHDTPVFCVILDGSMSVDFRYRRFECARSTVQVHPAGEPHAERIGRGGAQVLLIEPDTSSQTIPDGLRKLLKEISHFRHARIESLARRASRELRQCDTLATVALEALVLEMFVHAARLPPERRRPDALPLWFSKAAEIIHSRFLENLRIHDVADEVEVHPGHLARTFKEHYRMPLGSYLRRLRLDWAARRLAESDDPLTRIAFEAGFADQSHFTRAFKRHVGATPAQCRRNWQG